MSRGIIERPGLSCTVCADQLDRKISPAETIAWWQADAEVWIGESTAIRDTIYPGASEGLANLGYSYQFEHLATAERRLQQGGVRLAAYLDWLFTDRRPASG